jgi:hypothetical protein
MMNILMKLVGFIAVGGIVVGLFSKFPNEMMVAGGLAVAGAIASFVLAKR